MDPRRQLGPYRLLRRIGQGGMAEVWVAQAFGASGFVKTVALKILRPEHVGDGELERLLIEEARLGARLAHRNLLGIHDLGCEDGVYYVAMDWIDGRDLRALAAAGLPAPGLAVHVLAEVALALAYVHAAADDAGRPLGLVHRDLSPGNVLLSRSGEVKLADFGVAKATRLADVTRANVRKGTYAYMSPEQVARAPIGAASDQFAAGVMLYELLAGRRPYEGDSPLATTDLILAAAPPEVSGLPAALAPIVLCCLARDPAARFRDAAALHAALVAAGRTLPPAGPLELAAWVRTV
jgi:serine/threonine-protein kinase